MSDPKEHHKTELLRALSEGACVQLACRSADVPRSTAYFWKREDAAFADAWDKAIIQGRQSLTGDELDRALSQQRKRTRSRLVYLIRESFLGLIKIGVARNLDSRFRDLQNSCPQKLTVVGCVESPDALKLERRLHRRFEKQNYRGEWFDLSTSDVAEILAEFGESDE